MRSSQGSIQAPLRALGSASLSSLLPPVFSDKLLSQGFKNEDADLALEVRKRFSFLLHVNFEVS